MDLWSFLVVITLSYYFRGKEDRRQRCYILCMHTHLLIPAYFTARVNVKGLESNFLNMEENKRSINFFTPILITEWVKIKDIPCNPCIEG